MRESENIENIFEREYDKIWFKLPDEQFDPTKHSIATGDDGVLDDLFSFAIYNYIKNNWRAATAPADIQPGMIWSDSDDNKLYHHQSGGDVEIIQAGSSPQFVTVKLTALTDSYVPYHVDDATGLANSPISTDGSIVTIATPILVALGATPSISQLFLRADTIAGISAFVHSADNSYICFDMYWDDSGWKSSDAGSNFYIQKYSDFLKICYDSGVAIGVAPTMNDGIILDTQGNVYISTGNLTLQSATSTITGGTKLNIEAGGSGIESDTIYADVSGVACNMLIDANHRLNRSTSSIKYKDKVKDLELDSSLIYNLRPVSFNSKCKNDDKDKRFTGLIAEEIESIYPEIINYNEKKGAEDYDSKMLSTLMLAEIQHHETKIIDHEARIKALEDQLNN